MADDNSDSSSSPITGIATQIGGQLLSAVFSQLAQHSLRLKDAKAENTAVPQAVTALQQDMDEIAQALASGQASPSQAIAQLIHVEASIQGFLQSLVGKPGTAWAGSPSGCPGSDVPKTENGTHNCDKTCTAGCCIFFNYLEPAIDCFIKRLQRTAPGGAFAVAIPAIPGNKYGFPNFPSYTVTVRLASASNSVVSSVLGPGNFLSRLLGGGGSVTSGIATPGATRPASKFPLYIFGILLAVVLFLVVDRS